MPGGSTSLVDRLSRALALLSRTPARRLPIARARASSSPASDLHRPSPPTTPSPVRGASVAILLRVRPSFEDEDWLAEQYDADGQPLPGTEAAAMMQQLHHAPSSASPHPPAARASQVQQPPGRRDHPAAPSAPPPHLDPGVGHAKPHVLQTFFSLPWVRRGTPEIFLIKRATRAGDNWSAQVAFPGGRREEGDENGFYTALRETWEETGIDLAENKEFVCLGQLDDREITSSLGQRLLMILSPYIFLQISPFSLNPSLAASEVASAHWVPLSLIDAPSPESWSTTTVDVASRLATRSQLVYWALRTLVGCMEYRSLLLPNEPVAEAESLESRSDQEALSSMGETDSSSASASALDPERMESHLAGGRQVAPNRADDSPDYPVAALTHPHPLPHPIATTTLTASPSPTEAVFKEDRPPLRLWGLTLGMTLYVSIDP